LRSRQNAYFRPGQQLRVITGAGQAGDALELIAYLPPGVLVQRLIHTGHIIRRALTRAKRNERARYRCAEPRQRPADYEFDPALSRTREIE
jgi:hypothetical protein